MSHGSAAEELANTPAAVLVRDGVIVAAGRVDELGAAVDAEYVDLDGRCLMPGFIDPHGHFIMSGQMATYADLSDCTSFDDVVNTLKAYKEKAGDIKMIVGFGYDHNFLKEGQHPDKRVLDRVSTELPVFVLHVSVHFACGNSVVLRQKGIDENTPDPEGGKFGRLEDGKEPSGYFEETAMHLVMGGFNPGGGELTPEVISKMQENYLRFGVTTVQDGASGPDDMAALDALAKSGALKLDVVAYPIMTDHGQETMHRYPEYVEKYQNHVKIGGYKLVLDGSPQGRSAWMSKPYLGGDPDYCAYPWMSNEQVVSYIETALDENKQVLAHCNGDAASEQLVTSYAKAVENTGFKGDLRPVMIHCQTVRNDQLDRMAELKMMASIFVGHVWYWGDIHMINFGPERGNHISPAKDALDRGLHVNFHQDTPVTRPDMMHSVWCAVNRISRRGNVIGADQKIDVYDALRAITIEGAYEYFEEDSKGTIEAGKRADLVILDRSPLEVPAEELRDIKVLETIKDGTTVYKM